MSWRSVLTAVGLVVANVVLRLASYYAAPDSGIAVLFLPVPELFVFLSIYLAVRRKPHLVNLVGVVVASYLAVLTLYVLGEAFFLAIFRESFAPRDELRFLPGFLEMITGRPAFNSVSAAVAVIAMVALVPALFYASVLRGAARVLNRHRGVTILPILGLIVASIAPLSGFDLASEAAIVALLTPPEAEPVFETAVATSGESTPGWDWEDPAISILVLESYGHTLFTREDHRERIAPTYERLAAALQRGGVHVVSGFLESPAFGGRSWLADGTILAGQWLGNQRLYDAIIQTDASNLVRYLNDQGYRSVLAAPGMTYFDEGWLDFYAFEDVLVAGDYGYRGPVFDFGRFTDQYLLNYLVTEHGEAGDLRPRFLMAILVSTHVPFRVVPPYIENWSTIGDGSIYHELGRQIFNNNWLTGGEYPEGYTATFDYTLQTVVDYILQFGGDDELFLVLGDHQPRIPISEQTSTFSVPFHVLSRNRDLLRPFEYYGLEPGFVPSQEPPHPRMDTMYPMLREVIEGSWRYRRDLAGAAYSLRKKQSW